MIIIPILWVSKIEVQRYELVQVSQLTGLDYRTGDSSVHSLNFGVLLVRMETEQVGKLLRLELGPH